MVQDAWQRVVAWLEDNAPGILDDLRGGADAAERARLARALGRDALPEELDAWLSLHGSELPPLGRWAPLSPGGIARAWALHQEVARRSQRPGAIAGEPVGPVRPVWWSASWIPFASDGTGDLLCVDTDPAAGGAVGQLIEFRHDDRVRAVVAPSIEAWLAALAGDLEAGHFEYDALIKRLFDLRDADDEVW